MNNYWKIHLKNMDPLRIADDKSSQHGQTDTLRYIPGSALRGYVMSEQMCIRDSFWRTAK